MTVHAGGGLDMLKAAVEGSQGKVKILGVTVLTSLNKDHLFRIGMQGGTQFQAEIFAEIASKAGCAGVVCSARDLPFDFDPPTFIKAVPGISLSGEQYGDQQRVVSVKAALDKGANILIMGRSINDSEDRISTIKTILTEISNNVS